MSKTWLKELEGMRGLAALWVFSLHVSILSGTHILIVSQGALGVDLFILLSGFLMVHQFEQRIQSNPRSAPTTTLNFWCRRFFRIAPLYYVLLIVAFLLDPTLNSARLAIGQYFPATLTDQARYTDRTFLNFFLHLSFLFGFIPRFSFRTALPDWSIGLEMQFYALFPLLILLMRKWGYVLVSACFVAMSVAVGIAAPHFCSTFIMPSFLPLKLNLFLTGMLIAAAFHGKARHPVALSILFSAASLIPSGHPSWKTVVADIFLALFLWVVVRNDPSRNVVVASLKKLLNNRVCQKMGDISYSVYLLHLLFVLPMNAWLLHWQHLRELSNFVRFGSFFVINAAVVVPVSWLLYTYIEQPGIAAGKWLVMSYRRTPTAVSDHPVADR